MNVKFLTHSSSQHNKPTDYKVGRVLNMYIEVAHVLCNHIKHKCPSRLLTKYLQYKVHKQLDLAAEDAH